MLLNTWLVQCSPRAASTSCRRDAEQGATHLGPDRRQDDGVKEGISEQHHRPAPPPHAPQAPNGRRRFAPPPRRARTHQRPQQPVSEINSPSAFVIPVLVTGIYGSSRTKLRFVALPCRYLHRLHERNNGSRQHVPG